MQRFHLSPANVHFFSNFDRVHTNSLQVIVRCVILRFDCQSQRFNGAQVKIGDLLNVTFFIFQLSQIEPI